MLRSVALKLEIYDEFAVYKENPGQVVCVNTAMETVTT